MGNLTDASLTLPSLEMQIKIVEKLDKAFAEIDSLEKNLKLKEEKTNQLLHSMLSTALSNTKEGDIKVVRLGEICAFSRGLTYKKSDEVDFSKNIVLRANNIDLSTNSLLLDDLRYIKDSIKIDSEKLVKKNSLIICTASGSKSHLGKVALITEDFGYSFGGFMGQITPSRDCHHRFLFYIFTSPSFKDFLMGLTDGTNINNLKFTDIENYEVRLPKYEDQVKIVMKLDIAFAEIDKLKIQISIEKEQISSLRQSILSNAFNFKENVA
jgi:type I restriction enzyme S subunit